ncbi:MAG: Nitrogen permease regulator 2 [Cirrosporium novae-zelandiae]|nr:MAG: Nitrogen permease regulator 2 [Cirrosporium novae-zelandiae]
MIKAIFFSKFDTKEGPKVIHQVPPNSIVPAPTTPQSSPPPRPLISFPTVRSYIIPPQEFCGRPLSICNSRHRILGHPICLSNPRYSRNEFIFNFCVVVKEDEVREWGCYARVVSMLAELMGGLEEVGGYLSRDEAVGEGRENKGRVFAMCEMLMEDLNNYSECMIPIDDSNTLNTKLFPLLPPPPQIPPYSVPLLLIQPSLLSSSTLQPSLSPPLTPSALSPDLLLLLLLPHINGINSVARISRLANVSLKITTEVLRCLLWQHAIMLLDIFSFGAVYACTEAIGELISTAMDPATSTTTNPTVNATNTTSFNSPTTTTTTTTPQQQPTTPTDGPSPSTTLNSMIHECAAYVHLPNSSPDINPIPAHRLCTLFLSLSQGKSVRSWYIENESLLTDIDVRRFLTFGVIKGIIYRVRKYAVLVGPSGEILKTRRKKGSFFGSVTTTAGGGGGGERKKDRDIPDEAHHHLQPQQQPYQHQQHTPNSQHQYQYHHHHHHQQQQQQQQPQYQQHQHQEDPQPPSHNSLSNSFSVDGPGIDLSRYLDGKHPFDQISTETGLTEREILRELRRWGGGEVQIFCR